MSKTIDRIEDSPSGATLYLAFEMGNSKWKLGFTIGLAQRPRQRTIAVGDLVALEREIGLARKRFGLAEGTRVLSCYEAGQDGFWLHRCELTLWYQGKFGQGSKRRRKIGIVALARKWLVALWRYLEYGEIPTGTQLKTA